MDQRRPPNEVEPLRDPLPLLRFMEGAELREGAEKLREGEE